MGRGILVDKASSLLGSGDGLVVHYLQGLVVADGHRFQGVVHQVY